MTELLSRLVTQEVLQHNLGARTHPYTLASGVVTLASQNLKSQIPKPEL